MKLRINTTFDLSGDFDRQFENLKKLHEYTQEHEIPTIPSAYGQSPKEIGPNEQKYLDVSGKSRMNHRHKHMTREEQAIQYLRDLNCDIIVSDTPTDTGEETETPEEPNADPLS